MTQGTQTRALKQPRGVGWERRCEGGSRGRGRMYGYGLFMLCGRNQHNIVIILQLKINKGKKWMNFQ